MTTTMMRDSQIGDAWIYDAVSKNPLTELPGGHWTSGPVRLSWPQLFTAKASDINGVKSEPKFSVGLLFPPIANLNPLRQAIYGICASKFPDRAQNGQTFGLHTPLRDQAEKANKKGYTPGAFFMNASTEKKPLVLSNFPVMAPVTDERKVYPGVWAIVSFRLYDFQNPMKKGVAVGLNGVLLCAEDAVLGMDGVDPQQAFGHVQAVQQVAPAFDATFASPDINSILYGA